METKIKEYDSNNNDRNKEIFSFDYYKDPDTEAEYFIISSTMHYYEVPLSDKGSETLDRLEKCVNTIERECGNVDLYIGDPHIREILNTLNDERNRESFESGTVEKLVKEHVRAKLDETQMNVDISDIAKRLEAKGYLLRVDQGGNLLVQDANLSDENVITISKRNAYIEDVNLQSKAAIALYDEMKATVLTTIEDSFSDRRNNQKLEKYSAEIAGISISSVAEALVKAHMESPDIDLTNPFLSDMFGIPKVKYQFTDSQNNKYLSISLDYKMSDTKEKTVFPVISMHYGKAYGDFEKEVPITQTDIDAVKKNLFLGTNLASQVNDFASIGNKERESKFAEMRSRHVKEILDNHISKKFSYLNKEKIDYFTTVSMDYYAHSRKMSLAEYEIDKLKDAPFFQKGMLDTKILEELKDAFDSIDRIISPKPSLTQNSMDVASFSCKVFNKNKVVLDTSAKEPLNYDREWINKLAKLEDSILELRYGAIQDSINIAKSFTQGAKELLAGIAEFKMDGIYTGFDIGSGIASIREGWDYGALISSLEKEYSQLAKSENETDKIAAIEKKMDLKLLRADIRDNTDIYTKASISLRENCDKMMDALKEIIKEKTANILSNPRLQQLKKIFADYSKKFVNAYNTMKKSILKINDDLRTYCSTKKNHLMNTLNYVEAKTKAVFNNTKDSFNEVSNAARLILDEQKFTTEQLAKQLNDIKVEKTFESLSYNEFKVIAKVRFWSELEGSIEAGEEARRIPNEKKTPEDNQAIRLGEQMSYQKNQNLFVAEGIKKEIHNCLMNEVPYNEAITRLSKTYHTESMAFRLRNAEASVKNYSELSSAEKQLCQSIAKDLVHTMPEIEDRLVRNEVIQVVEKENNSQVLSDSPSAVEKMSQPASKLDTSHLGKDFALNFMFTKSVVAYTEAMTLQGSLSKDDINSQRESRDRIFASEYERRLSSVDKLNSSDQEIKFDRECFLSMKAIDFVYQANYNKLSLEDSINFIAESVYKAELEFNEKRGISEDKPSLLSDNAEGIQNEYKSLACFALNNYPEVTKELVEDINNKNTLLVNEYTYENR